MKAGGRGEVWTLAEIREGRLHPVSYELLAWGRGVADALGVPLASVVPGDNPPDAASLFAHGADKVYLAEDPGLKHFLVDAYAGVLADMTEEYEPQVFIASATTQGRSVMSVLYARLGCGLTADCTDLSVRDGLLLQTRPAIGGNVMADIMTPERRPQMCTVRPKSKRPLTPDPSRKGELVRYTPKKSSLASALTFLGFDPELRVGLPIQDAEVIVAGGKGMKEAKNFALLEELARLLGGSVGASRAAVDLGWAPHSSQVGLSGKSVTPRLYIAWGISGAVQHLAGMGGAETVVAVNIDPNAPIFGVSDFGVVGSALEVLPRLIDDLKKNKRHIPAGRLAGR
ncbi:MAG: electron transfer flavoprotein subunit alpha/FixB family protein [Synergistaceae bacterium]|jgi:electron transfer flavoprotein alpha subunit|nr:electron transfer flavoprotein subunit alpha/FixB family protein [Synergistaceae bacterium]